MTVGTNTLVVTTTETSDSNNSNNNDSYNIEVAAGSDLKATLTPPTGTLVAGTTLAYTLNVQNTGPSNVASSVSAVVTLPAGFKYVGATGNVGNGWNCTHDAGTQIVTFTRSAGLAANDNFPLALNLRADTSGANLNTVVVVNVPTGINDPDIGNNTNTATVTVDPGVDVLVNLTTSSGTVLPGSNLTFTARARYTGSVPPSNIQVTIDLDNDPANLWVFQNTTGTGAGWTCNAAVPLVCTRSAPGVSAGSDMQDIVLVAKAQSGFNGTVTVNTATVSATLGALTDADTTNNTSSQSVTFTTPTVDYSFNQHNVAPNPVLQGQNFTHTIRVRNTGTAPTDGTTRLVMDLPDGLNFSSGSGTGWTCSVTGTSPNRKVQCDYATSIGVNANSNTLTVTLTATTAGSYTQGTTISNPGGTGDLVNASNDTDSKTVVVTPNASEADLAITQTAAPNPVEVAVGTLTYTITVKNNGDAATGSQDVPDVKVVEQISNYTGAITATGTGWTCTQSGTTTVTVTCTLGSTLIEGATANAITISFVPNDTGASVSRTNTASVSSATIFDPVAPNNSAPVTVNLTPNADLVVSYPNLNTTTRVGATYTYTVRVRNDGPSNSTGPMTLTHTIPPQFDFVSVNAPGATCGHPNNPDCVWNTTQNNNTNRDVTFTVRPNTTGTVTLPASVTDATNDRNPGSDSATSADITIEAARVNLGIANTDSPDPQSIGSISTHTITANNAGTGVTNPSRATNVVITDNPPVGVTVMNVVPGVKSGGGSYTCTANGQTVPPVAPAVFVPFAANGAATPITCTVGTLEVGETASLTMGITTATAGSYTNNVSIAATETESNNANNSAAQTTTFNTAPNADMELTGSVSAASVTVNNPVTITYSLCNKGPQTPGGVVVTLAALPAGLTYASHVASNGNGTYSNATGIWTVGTAPAASAGCAGSFTLAITATATTPGSKTSTAEITASSLLDLDSTPGNSAVGEDDQASVSVTVNQPLPPLAANDTAITNLNTPVILRAFANDIAGVGGSLNLGSITAATSFTVAGEGTFVANANGTVTFTPVTGFVGVVTVPYTISDQSTPVQVSNIANLTVTVRDAPNNANPVTNDDFATTHINNPVTLPVASNDAPGTGKTIAPSQTSVLLIGATSTAQGNWVVNNDGTVTFTPANNFTGTATLPYTVQDSGSVTSNQATITVVVTGGSTVARDDSGSTAPVTPITLSVLNNDGSATGCTFDPATLDVDTATAGRQTTVTTAQGVWTAANDGKVTFTPVNGFTGTTTPQPYAVTDSCTTTVSAAITIIVNPTANPTAVNDAATTGFNTAVTLNPAGNDSASAGAVLNPSTVDLDPNTAGIQRTPINTTQGVWEVIDNVGTVRFTPANGYIGSTPAFTYAISDSLGKTATATMTVTVTTAPDMTVALSGFPLVRRPGAAVSGNVICTNSGGSAASGAVCAVSGLAAGATVTCSPVPPTSRLAGETINCAVNFTAPTSGLISLTATTGASNDTNPDNNTATGNIAIVDAVNDGLSTFPSSSGGIINVLGNDRVGNAAAAVSTTIGLPTLPNNGGLTGATFNAAGQLVIPANAVPGTYNLTYQICALNAATACDTATVQVTITATVGTISGVVFNDANGNSVQDSGELGISGVTVTLKNAQGATVNTTTTNASGQYSFSNVAAGSYSVVQTDLAGYTSTTPNTVAVTVAANGSATANFGDRQPSGTISGVVFNDANGNSVQNSGELGISGVTVTLKDGQSVTVNTTTTNASGQYSFISNVTAGSYSVVQTDLAGYTSTTPNTVAVTVPANGTATASFGDQQARLDFTATPLCLRDTPYVDYQVVPIGISAPNGVTLTWIKADGTTAQTLTNQPLTGRLLWPGAAVDANGIATDWPGWDLVNGQWVQINGGLRPTMKLVATVNLTAEFTLSYPPATPQCSANPPVNAQGAISGIVFNDANGNSVQDSGELGISGVTVTLKNSQGATVNTTTTNASGQYNFSNVAAGSYSVVQTDLAGYTSTTPNTVAVTVAANGSATAQFGDRQQTAISGVVFNDANGNGSQDSGEIGISGVTLVLKDAQGAAVSTTATNASGQYNFSNVAAGSYSVVQTDLAGYTSTTPNTVAVTVPANGTATANFGDRQQTGISGVVFNDANGNGTQNSGEFGISGVTVTLKDGQGVTVNTTTTNASGQHNFSNVAVGSYSVVQTDLAGYTSTTPNTVAVTVAANGTATANFGDRQQTAISGIVFNDANGNGSQDSGEIGISGVTVTLKDGQGVTVNTTTTNASGQYNFSNVAAGSYSVVQTDLAGYTSTTPNTVAVTVPANGSATANFGDRQPSGIISGIVFNDANGNGVQDSGELGISGVTVTLKDGQGATVKTAITDGSGQYQFANVPTGAYSVRETDPANFASTTVNEVSVNVTPAVPAVANFGDRQIGVVSGAVFNDINGNGVQDVGESGINGVRIELLGSNGQPIANITTDSNGQYAFQNVNPGVYTVRETDPTGYVSTTANTVAITVPANGSATAKFGDRQIGTISGVVFNDLNGNGVQDAGELGISGVTVALKDAQGAATVSTAATNANGQYNFSNVTVGSYQVVETDPAGYTSTTPNTVAVTLPANGSATANFGDRQIGAISGVVFNDLDGNGRQDTGETGISGVQVELLGSQGQSVAIMTTASNGGYQFENVEAGNYTVRETDPSGFVSTTPNSVAVSVPTGGAASANFGDQAINSLSGVVFNDLNNNGVRDPGEPTLGGVIVQLKNPAGVVIASATTANNGYYLFSNIVSGQYSLVQIMPPGFVGTTPLALTVTVPANGSATANFGDRQIGSVAGTVFNDINGNGFQGAGEAGISGVTITLKDAQGATVKTTITDANGQYSFNDVASGSYKVVETDPAGYTSTTANTVAVTVPVNGYATASFGDLKASPNVFDPPSGRKTVNADGLPVLEWRVVWINNGNAVANRVRVIDPIPVDTIYELNSLRCEARGESIVASCLFDSVNNQIVYEGDIAADSDALDEADAKNAVVIVFSTRLLPSIINVHNLATAYWDQGGDGNVDDDITGNQSPVKTNDGVPTRLPTDIPFLTPWLFWILAGLLALLGTAAGRNGRLRFGKVRR